MIDKQLPPKVLILTKDKVFGTDIFNSLYQNWYSALKLSDFTNLLDKIRQEKPNAIIIDGRKEDISFVQELIENAEKVITNVVPFIIISNEKIEKEESIVILKEDSKVQDILNAMKHLMVKFKPSLEKQILQYKDIEMDLSTFTVLRNSKHIHLGPSEFKILQLFLKSPNVIFSRKEIINFVWGKEHNIDLRTIDVHVNRIRTLIKMSYDAIPIIKTVRSLGYCMNLPGENSTR